MFKRRIRIQSIATKKNVIKLTNELVNSITGSMCSNSGQDFGTQFHAHITGNGTNPYMRPLKLSVK